MRYGTLEGTNMSEVRIRPWRALATILAIASTGCYRWVSIKPTELPKLNGSYVRATGRVSTPRGSVVTYEATVAHIERPDGTLVEVTGPYDAEITTTQGAAIYEHPVNSSVDGSNLAVQGANRRLTEFPLRDVTEVKVSQYNGAATSLLIAALSIGVGSIIAYGVIGAISK